ncbi:hypothetical protein FPSE_02857 [Fusarium pseudograminearum CS3096]|uniref:Uncharacterized protein n=1 Tax=Fusarium pseudograminearum (strain CS3096) TaxID=1028729 RepID=K3VP39_FUSPC|nr:hypothetical protein FPSE_02857 [Fusarium pseudograminearum CS3096]EKJ76982.1 hypothetical protein FPSE_02857 [Fusarium pseudograminearum CS3096]
MCHSRETFKELLLADASPSIRTLIDLNPGLARIDRCIAHFVQTSLSQPQVPGSFSAIQLSTSTIWSILLLTSQALTAKSTGPEHTVHAIASDLNLQLSLQLPLPAAQQRIPTLQRMAIASIGWVSFLFNWKSPVVSNICTIEGGPSLKQSNPHMEDCIRSINMFIRPWGLIPQICDKRALIDNLLYLSNLNFHSLTHIGRLNIKTLHMFQYPSICLLALSNGNYQKIIHQILKGLCEPTNSLHREVLLSLRFIFGATRKSRNLANKVAFLGQPWQDHDAAFDDLFQGKFDHILLQSPPGSSRTLNGQDFLTPWNGFPLLGERLLQIQNYNKEQHPTSTRAMIRDKRNPAQWYILWAVLLIGSLSLILSILQLGVGIAQLVTSS